MGYTLRNGIYFSTCYFWVKLDNQKERLLHHIISAPLRNASDEPQLNAIRPDVINKLVYTVLLGLQILDSIHVFF